MTMTARLRALQQQGLDHDPAAALHALHKTDPDGAHRVVILLEDAAPATVAEFNRRWAGPNGEQDGVRDAVRWLTSSS